MNERRESVSQEMRFRGASLGKRTATLFRATYQSQSWFYFFPTVDSQQKRDREMSEKCCKQIAETWFVDSIISKAPNEKIFEAFHNYCCIRNADKPQTDRLIN